MEVSAIREVSAPGDRLAVGKRLRELRLAAGITLKELAQRLGCSEANISLVEVGNYVPSNSKVATIAGALGASAAEGELRQLAELARAARTTSRQHGFGAAMGSLRRCKGWTQADVAERMGWSLLYVRSLENGHRSPPFAEICRLSALLEGDHDRGRLARLCMIDLGAIAIPIPPGADPKITTTVLDIASAFAEGRLGIEHPRRLWEALSGGSGVELLSNKPDSVSLALAAG
jgi:transcriptional regulator with XRE-family HTH domain